MIICDTRELVLEYENIFRKVAAPEARCLALHGGVDSKTKNDIYSDIDEKISNVHVFIFNTCVGSGVSIEKRRFTQVFAHFTGHTCKVGSALQLMRRVRSVSDDIYHVFIEGGPCSTVPKSIMQIEDDLLERKEFSMKMYNNASPGYNGIDAPRVTPEGKLYFGERSFMHYRALYSILRGIESRNNFMEPFLRGAVSELGFIFVLEESYTNALRVRYVTEDHDEYEEPIERAERYTAAMNKPYNDAFRDDRMEYLLDDNITIEGQARPVSINKKKNKEEVAELSSKSMITIGEIDTIAQNRQHEDCTTKGIYHELEVYVKEERDKLAPEIAANTSKYDELMHICQPYLPPDFKPTPEFFKKFDKHEAKDVIRGYKMYNSDATWDECLTMLSKKAPNDYAVLMMLKEKYKEAYTVKEVKLIEKSMCDNAPVSALQKFVDQCMVSHKILETLFPGTCTTKRDTILLPRIEISNEDLGDRLGTLFGIFAREKAEKSIKKLFPLLRIKDFEKPRAQLAYVKHILKFEHGLSIESLDSHKKNFTLVPSKN